MDFRTTKRFHVAARMEVVGTNNYDKWLTCIRDERDDLQTAFPLFFGRGYGQTISSVIFRDSIARTSICLDETCICQKPYRILKKIEVQQEIKAESFLI